MTLLKRQKALYSFFIALLLLSITSFSHAQSPYTRFRDVFPSVPQVNSLLEDDSPASGGQPAPSPVVYGLQPSCNTQDVSGWNLCLDLRSSRGEVQPWMEILNEAKSKWELVITGDIPSATSQNLPSGSDRVCSSYPDVIDDLYICASDKDIDGTGGILGGALPLTGRQNDGKINPITNKAYVMPLTGVMIFDLADIQNLIAEQRFFEVLKHEIGHVIGLGALWVDNGLYRDGTGFYEENTNAGREWNDLGCSGGVPVELSGGSGTAGSHWDEGCLRDEIMTGFISGVEQPFSRITIGSLEDLGYEVDYSQADPFSISDLRDCGGVCQGGVRRNLRDVGGEIPDDEEADGQPTSTTSQRKHRQLTHDDIFTIKTYAKKELSALKIDRERDMDDLPEGFVDLAGRGMDVFYMDASGEFHIVGVSWEEANGIDLVVTP